MFNTFRSAPQRSAPLRRAPRRNATQRNATYFSKKRIKERT
jgi:hypothetical protein